MTLSAAAPAGAGTWEARLELAYGRRGERTVPTLRRHLGPLRVQKHFEPEPGLCEHVIVHPPGGIAGGDRLELDVALEAGARVRLTTPGATRWYRSLGPLAASHLHARLGEGALLEWLPQEQIVFDGADALATMRFELAAGAALIAWDLVVLGRQAGAQPFSRGAFGTRLEVCVADRLVLCEAQRFAADDRLRTSPLGWAGKDVLATFVFVAPRPAAARALEGARRLEARAGASEVDGVLVARWLTDGAARAWSWLEALWALARPALGHGPAVAPRIWRT